VRKPDYQKNIDSGVARLDSAGHVATCSDSQFFIECLPHVPEV